MMSARDAAWRASRSSPRVTSATSTAVSVSLDQRSIIRCSLSRKATSSSQAIILSILSPLSSSILPHWVRTARGGVSHLRPTSRNSRRAVLRWRKMPPALSRARLFSACQFENGPDPRSNLYFNFTPRFTAVLSAVNLGVILKPQDSPKERGLDGTEREHGCVGACTRYRGRPSIGNDGNGARGTGARRARRGHSATKNPT